MDTAKLLILFDQKSNSIFDSNDTQDIELAAKKYPYFTSVHFLKFANNSNTTSADIAKLAFFKGDPYIFASFVKNKQKHVEISLEKIEKEDILSLINELPNSKPILPIKENKELSTQGQVIKTSPITVVDDESQEGKDEDKSLMVMMSFTDWLFHFKTKTERDRQEDKDKKALKTAWQKEKLAAATEEENEEIPEEIFKLAMNSISENTIISESLATVLAKQGKTDKAIDMYKKLSLRNPEKNRYFADRINELTTLKDY